MTIAGSDSGGGAGIQADVKTMTALGGFGLSVIAALTAQNGAEVRGIHEVPVDFVALQLETVLDGFPVQAAKTGMLASAAIIESVADILSAPGRKCCFPLVVDPVCVSQSGHRLLREDAEEALRRRMLPLADLLTPNKPEAELLSGVRITGMGEARRAVGRLFDLGARAVLLKGGHFGEFEGKGRMTDWLGLPGSGLLPLEHPRVETGNNHGTGCTLSSAIATFLGFGLPLVLAVQKAQDYLTRALQNSFCPGIGAGAPNFLAGAGGF
ncbi:bifunctional hydroxymethylpyrimidine kinase/phosphomethylpyrimidine kinase [Desulfovibrio sp. OttesenSCG-928-A18]|nr:bifunctional hydroxymethylpyrimidine kinase/phosphomethylpyrimidine kinase [Desulfovibrio sp. OttesenSCG-928-A18]